MNDSLHSCTNCHIGTLQRQAATYAAWHGDEFVVVPAAPAWVCDVCGERTFDLDALDALLPLIGPASPLADADEPTGAHRNPDQPPYPGANRTRRRA